MWTRRARQSLTFRFPSQRHGITSPSALLAGGSYGWVCEIPGTWRGVDRFHGIATRVAWGIVCGLAGSIVYLATGQLLAGYAVLIVCVLLASRVGSRSGWF